MEHCWVNPKYRRLELDRRDHITSTTLQQEDHSMAAVSSWFDKLEKFGLDYNKPQKQTLWQRLRNR